MGNAKGVVSEVEIIDGIAAEDAWAIPSMTNGDSVVDNPPERSDGGSAPGPTGIVAIRSMNVTGF